MNASVLSSVIRRSMFIITFQMRTFSRIPGCMTSTVGARVAHHISIVNARDWTQGLLGNHFSFEHSVTPMVHFRICLCVTK